jgi:hypothetical protein
VTAWDDGEIVWVECGRCGLGVAGFARENCPLPILLAAEKVRADG